MIYFVFLLYFVFDYVRPGSYIPGLDLLHLNSLIPLMAIIGTAVLPTPVPNGKIIGETNTKILGTLVGLLVLSTVFSPVTSWAYTVTKDVTGYVFIYWVLVRQVGDLKRLRGVFITLIVVNLANAALNPGMFTDSGRVGMSSGAFLGDGNDFALSVNLCVPLCLYLLVESRKKLGKLLWLLALLMLVLCVVATQSRGGTVALGTVALYYWTKSQRKVLTAALFVAAVALALAWAPAAYFDRMRMIADADEGSAQGRIIAWRAGTQMALANPILGAGAGHFAATYGDFYRVEGTPLLTAHSIYFLILGELGVPGIAVLLTFIFGNLAANRRLAREVDKLPPGQASSAHNLLASTSAALLAYATGGAFLSATYYPHMFVLAGMLVVARTLIRAELEAPAAARAGQLEAVRGSSASGLGYGISPDWRPKPAFKTAHHRSGTRLTRA